MSKKKLRSSIKIWLLSIATLFIVAITTIITNNNKVKATSIEDTNITYNEGQVLKNGNDIAILNGTSYVEKITIIYASGNTSIITNYDDMMMPMYFYSKMITISTSGSVTTTNGADRWNVEFESSRMCIRDYSVSSSCTYYTIVSSSGYTEEQYLAYGEQQYNAGYSAGNSAGITTGQNNVINNPNNYDLYTQTQYNNYGTNQYNSGYSAGNSAGITTGQNNVINNPNNYDLYTETQYNNYGTNQYNSGYSAGNSAGQNAVLNDPNSYDLYTQSQYNQYGQQQYTAGYSAGNSAGITTGQNNVINDPNNYDLYTETQYNNYGTSQYNTGIETGENNVLSTPTQYGLIKEDENFYNNTVENIYYKKYPNEDDRVDQNITSSDYRTSNGYLGFNNIISGVPNNTDLKDIFINTNQYYTNLNNLRIVFDNTYSNQVEYLKNSYVSLECIAIADINNYDYTTIHSCPISEGNYNNIDNLTVNLYTLYSYDQGGNLLNYFLNNGYPGLDTIGFKYNRIHFTFSEVSNTIPDSSEYVGAVVRGIQVSSVYNASYQEGYASGLLTNQGNVDKAYNDGYNVGKNKGYNDGYQAGSDINRGNTLVGLADTILTSPINMFETIFDFDFLGINLGAFFLSLVSLLVVIWLIKRMI